MKVLLIAGHGAGDPGAVATFGGKTYKEADETRALVRLLVTALEKKGIETVTYNFLKDAFQDYKAGLLILPQADVVLEVHLNAFKKTNADRKTKGVECYVTTGNMNTKAAETICREIAKLGFTNRGVKKKNFSVIHKATNTGMDAMLLEVCFIDDEDDINLLVQNREKVAQAIVDGLVSAYGVTYKKKLPFHDAVQKRFGFDDNTMAYLSAYKWAGSLLQKLATKK